MKNAILDIQSALEARLGKLFPLYNDYVLKGTMDKRQAALEWATHRDGACNAALRDLSRVPEPVRNKQAKRVKTLLSDIEKWEAINPF